MSALLPILAAYHAFSRGGRDLARGHLNYETVACYEGVTIDHGSAGTAARTSTQGGEAATNPMRTGEPKVAGRQSALQNYRVVKMRFAKIRDPETNKSEWTKFEQV